MLDWQAAWRKWMRNGKKWASRSSYGKVDRTNRNPDNVASREGETKVTYPAAHYRRLEALAQRELAQA